MLKVKNEKSFLKECRENVLSGNDAVVSHHEDSPIYGFTKIRSIFRSKNSRKNAPKIQGELPKRGFLKKIGSFFSLMKFFLSIIREIRNSFKELEQNNQVNEIKLSSEARQALWDELKKYSREKWGIEKVGFTKVPRQLIFQDKYILYPHALIFIDEMVKTEIDQAPDVRAGKETFRIYAHLGETVTDIARWLRKKGIRCQPNHPLGGLVVTPPLAGKAGMGGQGKNGLLITPEFGQRQRLAPIFIDQPIFEYTDSLDHSWIESYCMSCRLCQKKCPEDAILDETRVNIDNVEGIGQVHTCIDLTKCYPYFRKTNGCSICMKVCPFSEGNGVYYRIKEKYMESTGV